MTAARDYEDDWFAFGFPFFSGGFLPAFRGPGAFFGPCGIGHGSGRTVFRTGCFASGRLPRRLHPWRVRGHDRRGGQPGGLAFPGNPSFGETHAFGTPATGPRAVAGGRRPVTFPSPNDAGGIIYRTPPPPPQAPAATAPSAAPASGGMIGLPARPRGGAPPRGVGAPRRP